MPGQIYSAPVLASEFVQTSPAALHAAPLRSPSLGTGDRKGRDHWFPGHGRRFRQRGQLRPARRGRGADVPGARPVCDRRISRRPRISVMPSSSASLTAVIRNPLFRTVSTRPSRTRSSTLRKRGLQITVAALDDPFELRVVARGQPDAGGQGPGERRRRRRDAPCRRCRPPDPPPSRTGSAAPPVRSTAAVTEVAPRSIPSRYDITAPPSSNRHAGVVLSETHRRGPPRC